MIQEIQISNLLIVLEKEYFKNNYQIDLYQSLSEKMTCGRNKKTRLSNSMIFNKKMLIFSIFNSLALFFIKINIKIDQRIDNFILIEMKFARFLF
jgi:hypothetical protein